MKGIKIILVGIAFILFGIWGTIASVNGGGQFFGVISFICPIIGILVVFIGSNR